MAITVVRAAAWPTGWDIGTVDDDAAKTAVLAVGVLPGRPDDPNKIPTFWPELDPMPTISEIDFGDVTTTTVTVTDLFSSNRSLKRDRLLWHVQHPGQRFNTNPFTTMPMVAETDRGTVIVDGHHSLAACLLFQVKQVPVFSLPLTPNSPNAAK